MACVMSIKYIINRSLK